MDRAQYERAMALFDRLHGLPRDRQLADLDREEQGPSTKLAASMLALPDCIGDFVVLSKVAESHMSSVYEGQQKSPRRKVAIKVLRGEIASSEFLLRFRREPDVLARLAHRGIVKVHAVHEGDTSTGGKPYFVTEWIDGAHTLTKYASLKALGLEARLRMFVEVCAAVQHAHSQGIYHRDLKPGNVLVGRDGCVKVIDFGLAHCANPANPEGTVAISAKWIMGTLSYMSPEHVNTTLGPVDTRSDVFSLGVMLFELLTGSLPRQLQDKSPAESLGIIDTCEAVSMRRYDRSIPGEIDLVVGKALTRNKEHRYQSAGELGDDVQRFLEHQPVSAHRRSLAYRARKWVRRHPTLAALILVMATATVFSCLDRVQARRSEHAARRAAYLANVVAAEASIGAHEVGRAHRQLAECPPELRGWEWAYLSARGDESLSRLCSHNRAIRSARFSHDGARVVTASNDQTARVWSFPQGAELSRCEGHQGGVRAATFSPDDRELLTAGADGCLCVWDPDTGRLRRVVFEGNVPLTSAAWSPDGSTIAAAFENGEIRVWGVHGSALLIAGHAKEVTSVEFSPDGRSILTGSADTTARAWDAVTGEQRAVLAGHAGPVRAAAIGPSGTTTATASDDGTVRLWRAGDAQVVLSHGSPVWSVAFSADERRLATGTVDGVLRIWDLSSNAPLATLIGTETEVLSTSFSPDGKRVLTASGEGVVRIWDAGRAASPRTDRELAGKYLWIDLDGDGRRIVGIDEGRRVSVRSTDTECELVRLPDAAGTFIIASFDPRGDLIAAGTANGYVGLWDARTGARRFGRREHESDIYCLSFSPDASKLVSASTDGTARVWDVASGNVGVVLDRHPDMALWAAFSPDGRRIVTGSNDGSARIWDASSGRQLLVMNGHRLGVSSAAFSPDGSLVLTAGYDQTVCLWDATTGALRARSHEDEGIVTSASFNPDGSRFVTSSDTGTTGTVRVWDTSAMTPLITLRQNGPGLTRAMFSGSGRWIAANWRDGTVRLFDGRPDAGAPAIAASR